MTNIRIIIRIRIIRKRKFLKSTYVYKFSADLYFQKLHADETDSSTSYMQHNLTATAFSKMVCI